MKSNKMTLIAALAVGSLLVLSPATRAQDSTNAPAASTPAPGSGAGGTMRGRGMSADAVMTQLKLDDATKAKVKPILDAQTQKMSDLRKDTTLSREDRTAKMKAIHDDTATQLKPILTDDQYAQWQKMGQRNRRPAAGGDKPADAATPPAAAPQN